MKKYLMILLILFPFSAFADYSGPVEILSGEWGNGKMQFGIKTEYVEDEIPFFIVDMDENLIIGDKFNNRIKIYMSDGNIKKIFGPKLDVAPEFWPDKFLGIYNNSIFVPWGDSYQFYDYSGMFVSQYKLENVSLWKLNPDNTFIVYNIQAKEYQKYHFNGNKLNSYKGTPPELTIDVGSIENKRVYNAWVDDKKISIFTDVEIIGRKVAMDKFLNQYLIGLINDRKDKYIVVEPGSDKPTEMEISHYVIVRQNACDKKNIRIDMSTNTSIYIKKELKVIRDENAFCKYEEPVIDDNGNIYIGKQTIKKYSILKYIWQGSEDAPQSLQISAGVAGLKLNWQKPVKDADTVTGYQILRSTEVCGSFTEVKTVKKDKLAFEDATIKPPWKYYYVLKAVRDKKFSGDSNKVYMQWK
jgi:hypothetical protein